MDASFSGDIDLINDWIAQNDDINGDHPDDFTPLMEACLKNHPQIIKALLLANADINKVGSESRW